MKKLLLMLFALITTGAWAQTNIIANWDGGDNTGSPSNFGWTSSAGRTLQPRNNNGGIRMTTTYSGYKLEDGTSYSYSESSEPSSVIFWLRYNTAGESFTYTFQGLEPDTYYDFSALVGWHNNSSNPTFTIKINDSTSDVATMTKAVSAKQTLYAVNTRFKTSSTLTNTTDVKIVFTCSQTGDCMEAISALSLVKVEIVLKDDLASAISNANVVNKYLSDSDLTTAITNAQNIYDSETATQNDVNGAVSDLKSAISSAVNKSPLTLINPGFEDCAVTETNAPAIGSAAPMNIEGAWEQTGSAAWSSSAVVEYGGDGQVNGASAPATDNAGNTGKTLGISIGWNGTITYKSVATTYPAGVYTIRINGYNASTSATSFNSKFGFVPTSGSAVLSTKTSYTSGTWETDEVVVTLNEDTEGYIQIGGTAGNAGSGSHAKVFFDNITITYQDPLSGARALWQEAKATAETTIVSTDYAIVTGSERSALQTEIAKAEPTTAEGYEEATTALQTATNAFTSAKDAYSTCATAATAEYPILDYAASSKRNALDEACNNAASPTSAADANEKTAAITTALRAYYESHALAEGVEGAVDMTERVSAANADTNTGWTNGIGTNQGQGYTDAEGTVAAKYLDGGWASNAGANIDMTRLVEIPAGKYLLTVTARGAAALDEYTLSIGGVTVNLPKNGGNGGVFGNGWDDVSVEFETDGSAQTLEVKATSTASQQWMSINRFRLVRLELYTEMATAEDYAAMATALAEAKEMALGFDEGEYAPYNNVEAIKAIATAEAVDINAENAKADIVAITETLENWTANTEEVNAVYDGTLANAPIQATSENVVLPGWVTKSGNTRQTFSGTGEDGKACLADAIDGVGLFVHPGTYNYGETTGYTMPLKAGQKYLAEAKYCAWADGSNNNFTLTILKDGATIATKSYGANATACTVEGALKHVKLYFDAEEAGDYVLSVIANGNTFMTDFIIKKAVVEGITLNETEAYTAVTEDTYANVKMNRKVVAGINAVAVPFDLTAEQVKAVFGENAQVYTFEDVPDGENSQINFNTKETNTIEANVPVLVGGATESTTKTINGVILKAGEAKVSGTNFDFVGNYEGTVKVAANDYFVSGGKLYKSEGNTNLKSFRAFIQNKANTNGNVKLCIDGVATSIDEIVNGQSSMVNGNIYNLSGQRVSKATKGIYVKNGRKVVVK